jgi:hypothetical protein
VAELRDDKLRQAVLLQCQLLRLLLLRAVLLLLLLLDRASWQAVLVIPQHLSTATFLLQLPQQQQQQQQLHRVATEYCHDLLAIVG